MSDADDGYLRRAELLDDLGRYEEALAELRQGLARDPHNAEALTMLAMVQLTSRRPEEALTAADAALAIEPERVLAHVARGHAAAALRRGTVAIAAADTLLRLDPESWFTNAHYAAIVSQIRNGQRALDAAWTAVRLAPEEPHAHLTLAHISGALGLDELSERAYQEALRLDPTSTLARYDLGLFRITQGRHREGLEHIAAAVSEEPGDHHMLLHVRDVLARFVQTGAIFAICAPVFAAVLRGSPAVSRVTAAGLGIAALLAAAMLAAKVPGPIANLLRSLPRVDRWLGLATAAVLAAPVALVLYAVTGSVVGIVAPIVLGVLALTTTVLRANDLGSGA